MNKKIVCYALILTSLLFSGMLTLAAAGPTCGTDPVVLNAYFETGFDLPFKLSEEFTKQYPNVTWDIKQDQFANLINATPRLLSGDNPPDLLRLPTMVSFAKDGLLKNLDDYADCFRLGQVAGATAQPEPCRQKMAPAAPARSMPWASTTA